MRNDDLLLLEGSALNFEDVELGCSRTQVEGISEYVNAGQVL